MKSEEESRIDLAARLSSEEILRENELVGFQKFFTDIFGSIAGIGAVLNRHRQMVYANNDFLNMMGLDGIESILGNRIGEVLSCVHFSNDTGGCGTNEACQFCGAHYSILESMERGEKVSREALITTRKNGKYKSLDLKVISTPVRISGHDFLVLVIQDISSEKRRLALEKIFFHDLLNRAAGLYGLLSLLREENSPKIERNLIKLCEEASQGIIEELQSQRQIFAAETGDLQINPETVNSVRLIESVITKTGFYDSGRDRNIVITDDTANIDFETDKSILQRILINLLKNALEATPRHGKVLISADDLGDKVRFRVKNDLVIPKEIQMQLFQRSFTTKATGRGLGTYSIRLLTENYLGGNVSFISNKTARTVFMIDLYKKFPSGTYTG